MATAFSPMVAGDSEETTVYIPEEWSEAAETIAYASKPPIVLICGPKNSGKSTFLRHLLSILLNRYERVAYLDTDVGQPEFTPPGCVSLNVLDKLTPDLRVPPERCFFFGDVSSKTDPEIYLTYVFALYDHYHKQYCQLTKSESPSDKRVPLIVNTPGWVKGIGYDMLVDMLKHIAPNHVVKICISAESKNLPSGAFWSEEGDVGEATLIEINSARQDSFNRSVLVKKDSHHQRDLSIMAYFRLCFPGNTNIGKIKELARALAAHPPYEVPLSTVKIKHLHCQVPDTEIFYSLNATIVGLAISSEVSEHLPRCVGLGIVRAIDPSRRIVYVITPVPQSVLEDVDILLQGFIPIPTCLLQVQGCISPYMASNVLPSKFILNLEDRSCC